MYRHERLWDAEFLRTRVELPIVRTGTGVTRWRSYTQRRRAVKIKSRVMPSNDELVTSRLEYKNNPSNPWLHSVRAEWSKKSQKFELLMPWAVISTHSSISRRHLNFARVINITLPRRVSLERRKGIIFVQNARASSCNAEYEALKVLSRVRR